MNYDAFFSEDAGVMPSSIIRQLTGLVNRPDVISFAAGSPNAETWKVRAFYRGKRDIMLSVLEKRFGDIAEWSHPGGGLFLWVELLRQIDTLPLLREVVESEKIAFIPGQPFFVDGSGSNTLRLSFSNVSDENTDKGLERLERVVRARMSDAS